MVVLTNDALSYISDVLAGIESDPIYTIALGTGTKAEETTDSALDDEIDRWTYGYDSNVDLIQDSNDPSIKKLVVTIQGGNHLPDGTEVTEVGLFAGGKKDSSGNISGPNVLILRSLRRGVTIDDPYSINFSMPIDINRESV